MESNKIWPSIIFKRTESRGFNFFFDTETMGLSHGASNYIFLLGVGKVTEKEVTVTQYLLPGPGNEVALYQRFLTDIKTFDSLVTYNGRAFDWPQVKNRHLFVQNEVPTLPEFGHFDLLHASRRLFKHELEHVRLMEVEKEQLGFFRTEDTPGFLAPALYQMYLQKNDPLILKGVLEHNSLDILSLITLYIHLLKLLLNEMSFISPMKRYEIARWYMLLKMDDIALSFFNEMNETTPYLFYKKHYSMGNIYKRKKQFDEAIFHYQQCVSDDFVHIEACIELAKLYEHQVKNFEQALSYTTIAMRQTKKNERWTRKKYPMQEALDKRKKRLERKLQLF